MVQDVNLTSREWCDLIFEGKNKQYGAYRLRQSSNKRHVVALLVMLSFVCFIIALPYFLKSTQQVEDRQVVYGPNEMDNMEMTKKVEEERVIEMPKAPALPLKTSIQYVPPRVVANSNAQDDIITTDDVLASTATVHTITVEKGVANGVLADKIPDENVSVVIVEPTNTIFKTAEQQPKFPGGDSELFKYLNANLRYPVPALEGGIEGRVVVQFVVNKTGAISDIKIMQSLHPLCDKEAIRLISSMPKWIPGRQNGNPVNVYFTIPIRFKLAQQ